MTDYKFSRLLRLNSDSANLLSSNIPKNYQFSTNDPDLNQIRHVALKVAIIPNTEYNINTRNNVFSWDDGVARQVTLPVGQYDITELLAALNPLVQVLTPTLVITQTPVNLKLNFAAAVGITILITLNDPLNTMAKTLGVTSDSPAAFASFDAPSLTDLYGMRHVYVVSKALSNHTQLITGLDDIAKFPVIADIPISVPFGDLQVDNTNSTTTLDFSDYHSRKNITDIDISLRDENGDILELNGASWILVFRVYG